MLQNSRQPELMPNCRMDGKAQHPSLCCRLLGVLIATVILVSLTIVATLLVIRNYQPSQICGLQSASSVAGFAKKERWEEFEKLEIPSKNLVITRTASGKCFIMPKVDDVKEGESAKVLRVIPQQLIPELAQEMANLDVLTFCSSFPIFYAHSVTVGRTKRDVDVAAAPPSSAPPAEEPKFFGGISNPYGAGAQLSSFNGKSALDLTYEEREPKCVDLLLFCAEHVGQVQSCFTWINGVIWMDRKCTAENKFEIRMTKPPGRILKVAQQQWHECLLRKQKGLAC